MSESKARNAEQMDNSLVPVTVYILDDLSLDIERRLKDYTPKKHPRGDVTFVFELVMLDKLETADKFANALDVLGRAEGLCLFIVDLFYEKLRRTQDARTLTWENDVRGRFPEASTEVAEESLLGYRLLMALSDNTSWTGRAAIATSTAIPGTAFSERRRRLADSVLGRRSGAIVVDPIVPRIGGSARQNLDAALSAFVEEMAPHPNRDDAEFYLTVPSPPGGNAWFAPGISHDGEGMRDLLHAIGLRFEHDWGHEHTAKAVFNAGRAGPFRFPDIPDIKDKKRVRFCGKRCGGKHKIRASSMKAFFPRLRFGDAVSDVGFCLPCQPGIPFLLALRTWMYELRQDWLVYFDVLASAEAPNSLLPIGDELVLSVRSGDYTTVLVEPEGLIHAAIYAEIKDDRRYVAIRESIASEVKQTGGNFASAMCVLAASWVGGDLSTDPENSRSFLERTLVQPLDRSYIRLYFDDSNCRVGAAWPLWSGNDWSRISNARY